MGLKLMKAVFASALPVTERMVLLAVVDFISDKSPRNPFPSVATLTRKTGASERTVQVALGRLEAWGYMTREFRKGTSTVYAVTDPRTWKPPQSSHPHPRSICTPTPANSAPPPPQILHLTPADSAPELVLNYPIEPSAVVSTGFQAFWSAYPRRVAKADASKAWAKLKPSPALLGDMLGALERQRASEDWQRDGGKYIPHPSSWLNGRRWEDETSAASIPQRLQVAL